MLSSLEAAGFYPQTVSLQARGAGVDAYGVANGAYANIAGLTGLSCSVNRAYGARGAQEYRRSDATITRATHVIALAGYYAAITTAMQALVGTQAYNVLSVEHDSQLASTWLMVEAVSA